MIVDRFTKFILSIIAFSLCVNALNPWLSPTSANANANLGMDREIKKIAGGIKKIADNIEKMAELENDLFVFWPMTQGCENIVAMYTDQIRAMYGDTKSKKLSKKNQPCIKTEKKKIEDEDSNQSK